VLAVLLLHPVLSLALLGAINLFGRVSRLSMAVWIAAYTVLVVSRQYGVDWSEESDDDAPIYFDLIARMVGKSLHTVLFDPDLAIDIEPLPKLYWWAAHALTGSLSMVLVVQCALWTWALWHLCQNVARRHAVVALSIALFLIPTLASYEFLHLYRSAWALFFIALALASQFRESRGAYVWALLAVASHVSAVVFVVALFAGRFWADGTFGWRHLLAGAAVIGVALLLGTEAITENVFVAKLVGYSAADAPGRALRIVKAVMLGLFFLVLYRMSPQKAGHRSALVCALLIVVISLVPALNAVSDRLITLYVPVMLIGLFPTGRPRWTALLLALSTLRSISLLEADSVLRFSHGVLAYPLRVPMLDWAALLANPPVWPGT